MRRLLFPAVIMLLPACSEVLEQHTDSASFSPDLTEVDRIELRNGSGHVSVEPSDTVVIDADVQWLGDTPPDIDVDVIGNTLVIDMRCEWRPIGACSVDWDLQVPARLALDLETGSGDVGVVSMDAEAIISTGSGNVTVDGLGGALAVDTGSGDVAVWDIDGDLDADTGSGNIDAEGVSGQVVLSTGSGDVQGRSLCTSTLQVSTGSGNVDVQACRAPDTTVIETGSGDVDVAVPEGVYRIDTSTGSGDVTIHNLSSDAGGERLLRASTGSGNISLRGT